MYYLGEELNPNIPPAVDPNPNRVVPVRRPNPETNHFKVPCNLTPAPTAERTPDATTKTISAAAGSPFEPTTNLTAETRRELLKEVRDHLDLLKEFEGVVPKEELESRKRELFAALPPAPKKLKADDTDIAAAQDEVVIGINNTPPHKKTRGRPKKEVV